jgi:hypothetical protein
MCLSSRSDIKTALKVQHHLRRRLLFLSRQADDRLVLQQTLAPADWAP